MIKVTVGEPKTQSDKPFPKLMKHNDGTVTFFSSKGRGIHLYAPPIISHIIGRITEDCAMNEYFDINDPITIQNL